MSTYTLHHGDALEVMRAMPDASVDAVITDPPYGINMDKWDSSVPAVDIWREALRVTKPGGHLLSFFAARTYHRGAVAVEDAGWDIRDMIMWVYGRSMPTGMNISKAIDKKLGCERQVTGSKRLTGSTRKMKDGTDGMHGSKRSTNSCGNLERMETILSITAPASDLAKAYDGWNTTLKPAHEPIALARKPFAGTIVDNVMLHGTGGLNIRGCSIPSPDSGWNDWRWPANFLHNGERCITDQLGAAQRFFYCAKVNASDRDEGCEHLTHKNSHPTVKPGALMSWLIRLVTPPGGIVLDPFAGSGSTGKQAILDGFHPILIEREGDYIPIIRARCDVATRRLATISPDLFEGTR